MKRALLSCLVPVLIFAVAVGIVFKTYSNDLRYGISMFEIQSVSSGIAAELYKKDINYVRIRDYQDSAAKALKTFDIADEKADMADWASVIVTNTECLTSIICDSEGNGFDERGKTVNLSNYDFFEQIRDGFDADSSGVLYITEDIFGGHSVAFINGIRFIGGTKGYLVSILNVENLSEGIFEKQKSVSYGVWVAVRGHILTEYGDRIRNADKDIEMAWDALPENFNSERFQHALMQGATYDEEIPGYGYAVAVPAPVSGGSIIALISYDNMNKAVDGAIHGYFIMFLWIMTLTAMLIAVLFVGHIMAYSKRRKSRYVHEKDFVTGLLTEDSVEAEVNAYLSEPGERKGLMFLLSIDGSKEFRKTKSEMMDAVIIKFSKKLLEKYRTSDAIGRVDDEFVIFLKDIVEPKDVRKQIDELILLIHDFKNMKEVDGTGLFLSVGAAVAPKDGNNYAKLFASSRSALREREKHESGVVAFYHA
ncbi:MAG: diguanylate cyclase [Butyrivibrio sp.]|uniref:GGDEF domain-containing protein n=1 Tax=Butyrivibrio sp. TaxID=28121 RepID=UPI001B1AB0B8|nr:diguanylate cyclase [Butyrivibrio sp.]MBO6240095.1 diguanylate cyclase [Butyrivibrio sp.]